MYRPVFGLDIDGTIGDFHGHFFRFAEGWLGKEVDRNYDGSISMAQHLHVGRQRYRQIKLAYRMGGMKRSMPVFPWARDFTVTLRSWGVDVWVCTTRPYLSHDNIDSDTRHWLRRNGIICKGVIWGEHKYRELAKIVGAESVIAVMDDMVDMLDQASGLGIPTIMAVRSHNLQQQTERNVQAPNGAWDYEETLVSAKHWFQRWEEK